MKEGKRKKANTPLVTDMDLPTDVAAMVQSVLRESYRETSEDLRSYAEKVRYLNTQKKTVRRYLASLRQFRANVMSAARERGVDLCDTNENDLAILTKLFKEHARPYDVGEVEYELRIPNRVPRASADSLALLDNEIARWEERLATVGDDSQLANVDMQNMLQKQQQTMQMMSNISKMLHDTAMSVIRKLGG